MLLKILLLEDNADDAALICRLLARELPDTQVKIAIDEKNFLNALDSFVPDVILSDHFIPSFDSAEALAIIRERKLNIPFILLSGAIDEEYAAIMVRNGADDFILKDRMIRLPAAITSAVKQRQVELAKLLVEENYRVIMERVSDAIVSLDRNWNFTFVNKQAGELLEWKPEELIGKNIWVEFPEAMTNRFYEVYHQAFKDQVYIYMEEYYPPLDAWMENHVYPSQDGLSIFFRNVTARKRAEEKIKLSEQNLKAFFDNTSEGFVLIGKDGRTRAFNKVAEMMGYENNATQLAVGTDFITSIQPDRRDLFNKTFSTVLQGIPVQYDHSYSSGGITRWFNFTLNPVYEQTAITGVCLTGKNITERKLIEEQRLFDHNNLHALINNTHDLMWSVGTDFSLITSNEAFNAMALLLGGKIPVKGNDILQLAFNEQQKKIYHGFYERAFAGETFTELVHTSEPVEVWSEMSFYPIFEKNLIVGTACFSHDITQRKIAELKLQQLQDSILEQKMEQQRNITRAILEAQEKERNHIGMELHDNVNQILVGSILTLSLLQKKIGDNETLQQIKNYINLAIDENRKIAHEFVAPDLLPDGFVNLLKTLAHEMLGKQGITVNMDFLLFDENLAEDDLKLNLYRIVQEQCSNIIKHAAADTVQLKGETGDGLLHLLISDNGRGIHDEQKTKGIGLKNIKGRVSAFKGKTKVESSPGNGFELSIMIPLAS